MPFSDRHWHESSNRLLTMRRCDGAGTLQRSLINWKLRDTMTKAFHGAAVEPVVEFGNIVLEVFLLDFAMGAEQTPLQIG